MKKNNLQRKLISFTENKSEIEKVKEDMENGWSIVNLIKNGIYYAGIMERGGDNESLYIPPRKKIKILTK